MYEFVRTGQGGIIATRSAAAPIACYRCAIRYKRLLKEAPMSPRQTFTIFAAVAALAAGGGHCLAQPAPAYGITKIVPLGAPDRWDYLTFDPASRRVFIAHGDRVTVIDGGDGAVIGEIGGFPGGTHGIALAPQSGRGYSDDGKAGTVSSFDLHSLKRVKTLKAARGADGIVFDPASGHVFVINGDSKSVTVIDPRSDAPIATIDVGSGLEFATVDGKGKLYIDGVEKGEIVRVDTRSNTVDAHWALPGCQRPHGIAIDAANRRLFASCANNVMVVVDAHSGALVASLPIGSRSDAAAFDPVRKRAFSSNGDGTLSVITESVPDEFATLGAVATRFGARTMTLDPVTGRIYLVTADYVVNANADPADIRHRYSITPGSVKLIFLDPAR